MTNNLSSEILMAYVDGALDPIQRRLVEEAAADPEVAAEIAEFQRSRALLAAAFDAPLRETPPGRLTAVVTRAIAQDGQHLAAAGMPNHWSRRGVLAMALAAAAAFGFLLRSPGPAAGFPLGAEAERALLTQASGKGALLAGDVTLTPRLSFANAAQEFCREFALSGPSGSHLGLACRGEDSWRLELLTATVAEGEGLRPAAGEDPPELEAALQRLGAGAPLDGAQERCAIAAGWAGNAAACEP